MTNPTTPTTAGRDVDAEVAIKIMGYHRFKELCIITTWNSPDKKLIDEKDVPHYSTDISAAMEIRKKMRELGWQITINDDAGPDQDQWEVVFHMRDSFQGISVDAEHESLATAICLAALKAVGGRGE